jgi:hypothetical protein
LCCVLVGGFVFEGVLFHHLKVDSL